MNGRERALKALNREPVDRVPVYSHFRTPKAIEVVTGMDFDADPFAATAAAYVKLGIDMTKEICIPITDPPDGYVVNATGYGIARIKPETSNFDEFIEAARKFPDYDELKRDFDFDGKVREIREFFDRQQGAVGDSTLVTGQMPGCFDSNFERFGYESFMTAILLDPPAAEAAIRYHSCLRRLHAEAFVEAGCSDAIMYCDDIAGLNGLLIPAGTMRSIWLPHMKFAVEPLMEAGKFVIYHSDGNIRDLYHDIADAGFKGQHPLEPKSDMDVVDLKIDYGDLFIYFGGLCQVTVLPFGTVDEVRAEVRRLLDGAAPGGGYFVGSSGMCGPDVPADNAIAWIEEAKEYGKKFGTL